MTALVLTSTYRRQDPDAGPIRLLVGTQTALDPFLAS